MALDAVKGVKTLAESSSTSGLHPTVIAYWKKQLVTGSPGGRRLSSTTSSRLMPTFITPFGAVTIAASLTPPLIKRPAPFSILWPRSRPKCDHYVLSAAMAFNLLTICFRADPATTIRVCFCRRVSCLMSRLPAVVRKLLLKPAEGLDSALEIAHQEV